MNRKNINDFIKKNRKLTRKELAEKCGITVAGVTQREQRLGLEREWARKTVPIPEQIEKDLQHSKEVTDKKKTDVKYKYLLVKTEALQKMLSARDSRPIEVHQIKKTVAKSHENTAVMLWSDWHCEERVKGGEINNVNVYNLDIAKQRATTLAVNGVKLVKIFQKESPIRTLVIFLGGDFITGNLHEDSTEKNQLGTMEAIHFAKGLITSNLHYLLNGVNCEIVCVCHSGNHGRVTKKIHWGVENQNSVEWMAYLDLADHFKGNKRIKFIIPEGDMSYMKVYDKYVRFIHGHTVRYAGGIGGLTIPMRKAISQWDKVHPAMLTCFGHFHQRIHGGGSSAFIGNGSLIGYNAYGQMIKAEYEPPAQQFFLISSRNGGEVTVVCPIWVT